MAAERVIIALMLCQHKQPVPGSFIDILSVFLRFCFKYLEYKRDMWHKLVISAPPNALFCAALFNAFLLMLPEATPLQTGLSAWFPQRFFFSNPDPSETQTLVWCSWSVL